MIRATHFSTAWTGTLVPVDGFPGIGLIWQLHLLCKLAALSPRYGDLLMAQADLFAGQQSTNVFCILESSVAIEIPVCEYSL